MLGMRGGDRERWSRRIHLWGAGGREDDAEVRELVSGSRVLEPRGPLYGGRSGSC